MSKDRMPLHELLGKSQLNILDSVTDGVVVIDKEFRVVNMNTAAAEILNLRIEDTFGSMCVAVCKSERCQIGCPMTEVLRTGQNVRDLETTLRDSKGNTIPVKINASLIRDEKQQVIGGILAFRKNTQVNFHEYIRSTSPFFGIVGRSPIITEIFRTIDEISTSHACVLITGETGTGKELVADAIHQTSLRRHKPFVKVNCSAFPSGLLASELFGHIKGAFTGAIKDRMGRFEYADGGTIFLDEIGEMPMDMQTQLLRVLQEGTFERLGESKTHKVDVRIIAATNQNLQEQILYKKFRNDLFYRLNVIPIVIPPLKAHKDDIPLLVEYFIIKYAEKYGKKIRTYATDTMDVLIRNNWPGNIRELENAIEYAVIRSKRDDYICICSLPAHIREGISCDGETTLKYLPEDQISEKDETMLALLRQCDWNKSKAARLLGVDRTTIHRRLKKINRS